MKENRIYISGPVTGTKDYKERFVRAEGYLSEMGFSVVNPVKVNAALPPDASWEEYMAVSMTLLSFCGNIYMMDGWKESRGAVQEYIRAKNCGLEVWDCESLEILLRRDTGMNQGGKGVEVWTRANGCLPSSVPGRA